MGPESSHDSALRDKEFERAGPGFGTEGQKRGDGLTIAFRVAFATVLTLGFAPVLYAVLMRVTPEAR